MTTSAPKKSRPLTTLDGGKKFGLWRLSDFRFLLKASERDGWGRGVRGARTGTPFKPGRRANRACSADSAGAAGVLWLDDIILNV